MWSYIESFADGYTKGDAKADTNGGTVPGYTKADTKGAKGYASNTDGYTDYTTANNTDYTTANNTASLTELVDLLQQSQKMEENLYSILTKNAANVAQGTSTPLTQAEKDEIVAQINQFSAYRTSLYQLISTNYHSQIVSQNAATNTAAIQLTTLELLEKEMNKSKQNMAKLKDEHLNAMKMVEINTYYSKQYLQYQKFMKTIVLLVILLIASTLVRNRLSEPVGNGLFAAVVSVGFCVVLYQIIDIYRRSLTNYDTYIWPLAPTSAATLSTAEAPIVDVSGALVNSLPDICAGSYCCGTGTVWSDTSGCVYSEDYQIT